MVWWLRQQNMKRKGQRKRFRKGPLLVNKK